MNRLFSIFATILLAAISLPACADDADEALWMSVGVEKQLSKKWALDGEIEYRMKDHMRHADRWAFTLGAEYRLAKWLKADAGYSYHYCNKEEEVETYLNDTGKKEITKTTDGFMYSRHRVYASLTGTVRFGNLKLSLRERWQYTYRPSKITDRTKVKTKLSNGQTETYVEEKEFRGDATNMLRSRLMANYSFPHTPLSAFASAEIYTSDVLEKMKYSGGIECNITKQCKAKLYYLYYDRHRDEDPNSHVFGAALDFKI